MEGKIHVVVMPFPAQGHIFPVVHLARKLAAQGFLITLISIDSMHRKLSENWNLPHIRLAEVICDVKMPRGVTSPDVKDMGLTLAAIERLEVRVKELLRTLEPAPRCFIADYFLTWASRVALDLGISPVTYFPGNAAYNSLHEHFELLVSRGDGYQDETDEVRERLITYVPGIDPLKFEDLPHYFKKDTESHETQRLLNEATRDRMKESEWILVNSMEELEPRTFQAMQDSLMNKNFVSIGPLFPLADGSSQLGPSLRDVNHDCLRWLDTQAEKSVLYVSFGSVGVLSEGAFEELLAGLEGSKQPFLLVSRDLVEEESNREKYIEFVNRTREQGLVVSWVPQLQVLSHSSVGGFLSHCGWNSTFESVCHGVPLLGCPLFADQRLNCKLVTEDWGVGKLFSKTGEFGREEAETGRPSRWQLAGRAEPRKIREFMVGDEMAEMRSKLQTVKETAGKTVKEGGASYANLVKFVNAMVILHK